MSDNLIGKEIPGPTWYVERGKIAEFANALGDENPLFFDTEAARAAGLPDVIAPPTFAMSAGLQARPSATPDPRAKLNLDPKRVLHGEQEFEMLRPIVAGDVFTSVNRVARIEEKEGRRGGKMRIVTLETVYRDREGRDVLIARNTLVERAAPPS